MCVLFVGSLKMTTAKSALASLLCQLEQLSSLHESLRIAYAENGLWTPVIELLAADCRRKIEKELIRVEEKDDSTILDVPEDFIRNLKTLESNYDLLFNTIDLKNELKLAIQKYNFPLMKLLCVSGLVDCNYALVTACAILNVDAVEWLLGNKELPINPLNSNNAALRAALSCATYPFRLCEPSWANKIFTLLLKDGRVDPTIDDNALLHYAVINSNLELLDQLLTFRDAWGNLCIDPSANNNKIVETAYRRGTDQCVERLLKDERIELSDEKAIKLIACSPQNCSF